MPMAEQEPRGRSQQPFSVGLFIQGYLKSQPEQTAYCEAVHHAYKQAWRWITEEQVDQVIRALPEMRRVPPEGQEAMIARLRERRLKRETVMKKDVRVPEGEVRVTVYRLLTKRGRPYRLATYASFSRLWNLLVQKGILAFVDETPAPGRIDPGHKARFERWPEDGRPLGRRRRPQRRYYQLTADGEALGEEAWRGLWKYYQRERVEAITTTHRVGLIPLLAPPEVEPEVRVPALLPPKVALPPPVAVPPAEELAGELRDTMDAIVANADALAVEADVALRLLSLEDDARPIVHALVEGLKRVSDELSAFIEERVDPLEEDAPAVWKEIEIETGEALGELKGQIDALQKTLAAKRLNPKDRKALEVGYTDAWHYLSERLP